MIRLENNRFLQPVNSQINRAKNDSGVIDNHTRVQKFARTIVDLGLWGNLKLWIHNDLTKKRQSGSDFFCEKSYDNSKSTQNHDGSQTDTTRQPRIITDALVFDGVNDFLNYGKNSELVVTGNFTYSLWIKTTANYVNDGNYFLGTVNTGSAFLMQAGIATFAVNGNYSPYFFIRSNPLLKNLNGGVINGNLNDGVWHHVVISVQPYSNIITFIIDGEIKTTNYINTNQVQPTNNFNVEFDYYLGARNLRGTADKFTNCQINDFQFYNINLNESQGNKIFNDTKSSYGL